MQVSNQKPAILSPVYKSKFTGDFEPLKYMKQTLATPLFNPVVAGTNVTISDHGAALNEDDIVSEIVKCCGDTVDPNAETKVKQLLAKTLVYFDATTNLSVQNAFAIQAAVEAKLPFPSAKVQYTPAIDVIPASKEFLAGQCDYAKYFASLAFYARPNTLGFYFANDTAFTAFKTWLNTQTSTIASLLPAKTNQLFQDFQTNITLNGLTESLILRNNDSENNEDYSFARTLIAHLMIYTKQVSNAEFGVLPFLLGELYCPRTIVFVNVEKHAHATAKQVADEWNIINQSLSMKIPMVSNNKLSKLTATARSLHKMAGLAATASSNAQRTAVRCGNAKFRKMPPTTVDLVKVIAKVSKKMTNVAKSENSYKSITMSYARPNRRNPDDFNKQGKMVSTKYKPDIHIYLDNSGSISEQNYQDAIKALIKMAKKLNVNLYFNSFSHQLSQCTKLNTKDKSLTAIYAEFQKIPKVGGGTDYEQIWHYINRSKKRRRELSLIITDFEWYAPNHYVKHPKNLYYIPCSHMDWDAMTRAATSFCNSMKNIDPNCRTHLLF